MQCAECMSDSSCGYNAGMLRITARLLMYRPGPQGPQVLLAHPGGPFGQISGCRPGSDAAALASRVEEFSY